MLKVLHVNYSDINGGAAIGVKRLHKSLVKKGIKSSLLVADKSSREELIFGPTSTFEIIKFLLLRSLSRVIKRLFIKTKNPETFSFNFIRTNILKKINNFDCDIVNLHWIGNEMISIDQINKINKPIVWTFWDMWPFCGAEHYTDNKRYQDGYNKNNKDCKGLDISRMVWNKKKKLSENIEIICPSQWMYDCVKNGSLYKKNSVNKIPFNLDTEFWSSSEKEFSKKNFGIPDNKKIVLFGSSTSANNRKGFDIIINLLNKFKNKDDIFLILFGLKPNNLEKLKINYKYLGEIKDEYTLKNLYSASDLLLMPSLLEAFGQISSEAASCGVPSLIFEKTGMVDFIEHKFNGYVSIHKNEKDLLDGLNWCLKDENLIKISQNARNKIVGYCNDEMVSEKYIDIYKKKLSLN